MIRPVVHSIVRPVVQNTVGNLVIQNRNPQSITLLSVVTTSDTEQTITPTFTTDKEDGISYEFSIDLGLTWNVKGTSAGVLSATGLTADTVYFWRARVYKSTKFGSYSPVSFSRTFSAQAITFFTASGITDSVQKNATNNLIANLKAITSTNLGGTWPAGVTKLADFADKANGILQIIYPFVGGTAAAHKYNLLDPRDDDGAYRMLFTANFVHNASGVLPNGSSDYGNPKWQMNYLLDIQNASLAFWSDTDKPSDGYDMGCYISSTKGTILSNSSSVFTADAFTYLNDGDTRINRPVLSSKGLLMANRIAINNLKLRKGSLVIAENTTNQVATLYPDRPLFMFAGGDGVTPNQYSNRKGIYAHIGKGIPEVAVAPLVSALNQFQNELSRGNTEIRILSVQGAVNSTVSLDFVTTPGASLTIDWGDGVSSAIAYSGAFTNKSHTYTTPSTTFVITIYGEVDKLTQFRSLNTDASVKIDISEFYKCVNLVYWGQEGESGHAYGNVEGLYLTKITTLYATCLTCALTGSITGLRYLQVLIVTGVQTLTGSVTGKSMTWIRLAGNVVNAGVGGDVTGMPLTVLRTNDNAQFSGIVPSTVTRLWLSGTCSCSGIVSNAAMSEIFMTGPNTVIVDVTLMADLTYLSTEGSVIGNIEGKTKLTWLLSDGSASTLTGSIAGNILLQMCYVKGSNTLTFPNVTNLTGLFYLYVHSSVTLTSANVNQILADFVANKDVAKGSSTLREINLLGSLTTGAPTGQGIVDKGILAAYNTPPGVALWSVNTR